MMTHDELVVLSARWLRTKKRLPIVLQDVRCMMVQEQPDAIGWNNSGFSVLVECKASREDLARDRDKPFRKVSNRGMGHARYYAIDFALLNKHPGLERLIPENWGIVAFLGMKGGRGEEIRKAQPQPAWNDRDERSLLVQALRKATEGWGRRTFGEIAPPLNPDGDPHPTASKIIKELRMANLALRKLVKESELKRAAEVVAARHAAGLQTDEAIAKLSEILGGISRA